MPTLPALDPSTVPERFGSAYPEQYRAFVRERRKRALGNELGLTHYGVNLVTVPPGAWSALRHWHTRQDEFIYVVSGRPTLVMDGGATQLEPGMCMGFKAGDADGHHLVNKTAEDVVYLEMGDRSPDDSASYPDDDLKAVMGGDGQWRFLHKDGTPY